MGERGKGGKKERGVTFFFSFLKNQEVKGEEKAGEGEKGKKRNGSICYFFVDWGDEKTGEGRGGKVGSCLLNPSPFRRKTF